VALGGIAAELGARSNDILHLVSMIEVQDMNSSAVREVFRSLPWKRPFEMVLERAGSGNKASQFLHTGGLLKDLTNVCKGPSGNLVPRPENPFKFTKTLVVTGKTPGLSPEAERPDEDDRLFFWPEMEIRMRSVENNDLYVCHEGTELKTCINPPTAQQTILRQFVLQPNPVHIRVVFSVNVGSSKYFFNSNRGSNSDRVQLLQGSDKDVATLFKPHDIVTSQNIYLFEETVRSAASTHRYKRVIKPNIRPVHPDHEEERARSQQIQERVQRALNRASGRFMRALPQQLVMHAAGEAASATASRLQVFLATPSQSSSSSKSLM